MNESNAAMCERAARFMRWLMLRPEREIAVVMHSAFMSAMLREFGADERLGCTPAVTEETRRWPNNCELRPMMLVDPGGGRRARPHVLPRRGYRRGKGCKDVSEKSGDGMSHHRCEA